METHHPTTPTHDLAVPHPAARPGSCSSELATLESHLLELGNLVAGLTEDLVDVLESASLLTQPGTVGDPVDESTPTSDLSSRIRQSVNVAAGLAADLQVTRRRLAIR